MLFHDIKDLDLSDQAPTCEGVVQFPKTRSGLGPSMTLAFQELGGRPWISHEYPMVFFGDGRRGRRFGLHGQGLGQRGPGDVAA